MSVRPQANARHLLSITRRDLFIRLAAVAWLSTLVMAQSSTAAAQTSPTAAPTRGIAASDVSPSLDNDGFVTAQGTITPGHLRSDFTLSSHLALSPLRLRDAHLQRKVRAVSLRVTTWVQGQLGFGDRFATAIELPVVAYQHGDAFSALPELSTTVLADPRLRARYRLWGAVATPSGGRADGPGIAIEGTAHLPLGTEDAFAGEAGLRGDLTGLIDFQLLGAGLGGYLGLRHRFATPKPTLPLPKNQMRYGLAAKLPLPFWPQLTAIVEFSGRTDFRNMRSNPSMLRVGARIAAGDWSVLVHAGVGLAGQVASPDGTVSMGLRYRPADTDADKDGIPDDDDECPLLPEDLDGFQDDDGCEDPDNDNDFVPDADDLCPNEEAREGNDSNFDGCNDKP